MEREKNSWSLSSSHWSGAKFTHFHAMIVPLGRPVRTLSKFISQYTREI